MPIDGVFVHYLTCELNETLKGGRINKIYQPHPLDLIFQVRNNNTNYQLLLSSNLNAPRINITGRKYDNPDKPYTFCTNLRKYLERGFIESITQISNDRVVKITINSFNELGDEVTLYLFLELMGRNANIILTDKNLKIIEAIRHFLPDTINSNNRIILPKVTYEIPLRTKNTNIFSDLSDQELLNNAFDLEGCSKLFLDEVNYLSSIKSIINRPLQPVFYPKNPKNFYVFPLKHLEDDYQIFPTLSLLLDFVYKEENKKAGVEYHNLSTFVKREINKLNSKLKNLNKDRDKALPHLEDKTLGLLIQANLWQIKKGDTSFTTTNFYQNNEEITINLDPLLDPSTNMKRYFTLAKKAENTLKHYKIQTDITLKELQYLDGIKEAIEYADRLTLLEIKQELVNNGYLKENKKQTKKLKISYTHYIIDDAEMWIGKNNLQNDYLTNHLAKPNDYWFHVKDAPGSHVILRCSELNEKLIRLASLAASLYSKYRKSSSVAVDYTMRKYIKKIPGLKGCEVTYTNQKTIYIDPDEELFQSMLSS
ncbi:MAG: NFACT family protein [Bacilli bacterium]|nr:NFACT family protein [Bacilli bacterium]